MQNSRKTTVLLTQTGCGSLQLVNMREIRATKWWNLPETHKHKRTQYMMVNTEARLTQEQPQGRTAGHHMEDTQSNTAVRTTYGAVRRAKSKAVRLNDAPRQSCCTLASLATDSEDR